VAGDSGSRTRWRRGSERAREGGRPEDRTQETGFRLPVWFLSFGSSPRHRSVPLLVGLIPSVLRAARVVTATVHLSVGNRSG
jgi:hypothetical protein